MNKKIAVAVSGGIDSLVAAFLLEKQGADVFGLHFVTGFEETPALDEGQDHMTVFPGSDLSESGLINNSGMGMVAGQLGIPVHVIDIRKEFRAEVSEYFYRSYLEGLTPNPCIVCNSRIKFGLMIEKAGFFGADFLATGHYAGINWLENGMFRLLKGTDPKKDQSYFLSHVKKDAFKKTVFPLSGLTKHDVFRIASDNGLKPLFSRESQDICFIRNDYGSFMEAQPGFYAKPGEIVDSSGKAIGRHKGLHLFTIGQRRGINCPAKEPYYVLRLDTMNNRLVVGFKNQLHKKTCTVNCMNWLNRRNPGRYRLDVKTRYAHVPSSAEIRVIDENICEVLFDEPQISITPGQAAVLYDNDELIGGGFICRD